jgi:hypothetical protein
LSVLVVIVILFVPLPKVPAFAAIVPFTIALLAYNAPALVTSNLA